MISSQNPAVQKKSVTKSRSLVLWSHRHSVVWNAASQYWLKEEARNPHCRCCIFICVQANWQAGVQHLSRSRGRKWQRCQHIYRHCQMDSCLWWSTSGLEMGLGCSQHAIDLKQEQKPAVFASWFEIFQPTGNTNRHCVIRDTKQIFVFFFIPNQNACDLCATYGRILHEQSSIRIRNWLDSWQLNVVFVHVLNTVDYLSWHDNYGVGFSDPPWDPKYPFYLQQEMRIFFLWTH